ncbi:hypothetical protein ACLI4U_02985 [Natrialbaceae archaeon A-CW2]|uniref:hypothetical protein n=1 Tax=Natronosalvus amylolyticus TaxID=2961994 RepID=UPI0020C9D721|nr:hypothetical protein [Natronosalvus amylolyticus]
MTTSYTCVCGATLTYRQDLEREDRGTSQQWFCGACRTPVPGIVAERISHQHPS